jgi:hypothetical protein
MVPFSTLSACSFSAFLDPVSRAETVRAVLQTFGFGPSVCNVQLEEFRTLFQIVSLSHIGHLIGRRPASSIANASVRLGFDFWGVAVCPFERSIDSSV